LHELAIALEFGFDKWVPPRTLCGGLARFNQVLWEELDFFHVCCVDFRFRTGRAVAHRIFSSIA
jgi:hypothetical protein